MSSLSFVVTAVFRVMQAHAKEEQVLEGHRPRLLGSGHTVQAPPSHDENAHPVVAIGAERAAGGKINDGLQVKA